MGQLPKRTWRATLLFCLIATNAAADPNVIDPSIWAQHTPPPSVIYLAGCLGADDGSDFDQNGISDGLEAFLAATFEPAFFINRGSPLSPEPVEILDRNGDGVLGAADAFVSVLYTRASTGTLSSFQLPFCEAFSAAPACASAVEFFHQATDGPYSGTYPSWAPAPVPGSGTFFSFYDYGAIGSEGPVQWDATINGSSSFGGAAHDPKIYCHFRNGSPSADQIEIQYWFFYPYNDGWNDHEGDWEHITVIVQNSSPCVYEMKTVYSFFHEDYFDWDVSADDAPYRLDGTHVVVFVGGTVQGSGGTGDEGGGSYPMFGSFLTRWDVTEHVRAEGTTLHYNEVDLEIIPNTSGSADLSDWYRASATRQWMNPHLQWGYPVSDSPLGISNDSPITPAHKAAWNSTTGGATQRPPEMFFDDWMTRESIVMVSPVHGAAFVPAQITYEDWASTQEVLVRRGTHHVTVDNPDRHLKITAERFLQDESGDWLQFVGWDHGIQDNPIYLDMPPSWLDDGVPGFYHLKANYEVVTLPPEVNSGAVEIAHVDSGVGSYPEGVVKAQCVDKLENLFVAWCETSGALHVQKLDARLNAFWGATGIGVSSPSGGTIKSIEIVGDGTRGGAVVVWHEVVGSGTNNDRIYAVRIGSSGAVSAGPLLVYSGEIDESALSTGDPAYLKVLDASPVLQTDDWEPSIYVIWRSGGSGLRCNLINTSHSQFVLAWSSSGLDVLNGYLNCASLDMAAMIAGAMVKCCV